MSSSRIHPLISIIALGCLLLLFTVALEGKGAVEVAANWLYSTAVALGTVTLLLGVLNVMLLHLRRIRVGEREWSFSLVLLLCLIGTVVAGLVAPDGVFSPIVSWLFERLIAPGERALFALLPFFLAVAAWRYLRIDRQGGVWLLAGVLLMLFVQLPTAADGLRLIDGDWFGPFFQSGVGAVMQGVLLGGSLTLVAAGVRLILGRR